MPTVTGDFSSSGVNSLVLDVALLTDAYVVSATSTSFVLVTRLGTPIVITGSFSGFGADGWPSSGVVSGISIEHQGRASIRLTEASIPVAELRSLVLARDTNGLRTLIYGQNDHQIGTDLLPGMEPWDPTNFYGRDALYGFGGDDFLQGSGGTDSLFGGAGRDRLEGGAGSDVLIGGDDFYLDDLEADILDGGAQDDTVFAGRWDTAIGGEGQDRLFVVLSGFTDGVVLDLSGSDPNAAVGAVLGSDVTGFESFTIIGGQGADTLTMGDDFSGNLSGGAGADTLVGGAGTTFIFANAYDDAVLDDGAVDIIYGGDGWNYIHVGLGDIVDGGGGFDYLTVTFAARGSALTLDLTTGAVDAVAAASGGTFTNIEHVDQIFGTAFGDTITGTSGYEYLWGGGGNDVLIGGGGSDRLSGGMETIGSRAETETTPFLTAPETTSSSAAPARTRSTSAMTASTAPCRRPEPKSCPAGTAWTPCVLVPTSTRPAPFRG